jgi:Fe-S-cluster-containing hydrogenase component 2
MKRLLVTPIRCTGCRTCELACAFSHPADGEPGRSAIRAFPAGGNDKGTPVVCLQCDSAACVAVCPVSALSRQERTGAVVFVAERCIGCKTCVYACPFGNIGFDDDRRRVIKCDLCGGSPRCAQFCPTRTLEYV